MKAHLKKVSRKPLEYIESDSVSLPYYDRKQLLKMMSVGYSCYLGAVGLIEPYQSFMMAFLLK